MDKKKRKAIPLTTKLEILYAVDQGGKKADIAKRFNIPNSTLSTIISQRKDLERNAIHGADRKRQTTCKNEELEKKMFDFLMECRSKNVPISGSILQEKAKYEALRMGINNFQASNGWLQRFKCRWNLSTLKTAGEEGSVDPTVLESWQVKLQTLTAGYSPCDVFNADEAGIFFNLLPDKTLALKGEKCHGGKSSKERFTVLLCANSDGSEKLTPLVIGKFSKPRCFKNIKHLPCTYKNNSKAWMTSSLFREWLFSLDARMGAKNRKILLFLDCCTAHKLDDIQLRNIKVIFFPPNCTSKLQPLDQGVISQLKRMYRRQLVQYLLRQVEIGKTSSMKWNILQAMQRLCYAWDNIEAKSISNCFRKAGFPTTEHQLPDLQDSCEDEWMELPQNLQNEATFQDYVDVDSALETCSQLAEQTNEVSPQVDSVEETTEETTEEEIARPSRKEVNGALDILERFFLTSETNTATNASNLKQLRVLESVITKELNNHSKQSSITDFFTKK